MEEIKSIQRILGVTDDGVWGKKSQAALDALSQPTAVIPQPTDDGGMHISQKGIDLVKEFEGLWLVAARDEVGIPTVGYGHTGLKHNDGTVYVGRKITREEAESLLRYDMRQFENDVKKYVTAPMTQDQFDALVSFDFNTGGLGSSTLLKLFNKGDTQDAAEQFLRWNKAGGQVLAGLTRRRKSERNLFLGIDPFIVQ